MAEPAVDEPTPDAWGPLVERCRAGEQAAFRELYRQCQGQVASRLAFLVPRADVEDVMQDVFVEVFRSIRRFEGRSSFTTWLYRLVVNVALKSRRRGGKVKPQPVAEVPDQADPAAGPDEAAMRQQRLARVEGLLDTLAPKKRAVLVLHDLRGMDAARIAEMTGTNIMTVRTRLFYARHEFEAAAVADPALAEFFQEPKVKP